MTGDEVRTLRRRLGLTQTQLAEQVGVHGNTVARWERGEVRVTEPMARLLRLLAKARPGSTRTGRPRGR